VNINPFKSDAAKKLAGDLDRARAGRVKLSDRLTAAQSAVTERQAATRALACDGADDGALDAAEAALRAAQDRVATLSAALGDADTQVAVLESEQAHLADQRLRAESAAAIEAMAHEIEKAGVAFGVAAAQLTEISRRVAEIVLDGHGLAAFAMNAGGEVPAAVEMIARLLRDRARATIDGAAPAALPKAETVPLKASPPAPPETEMVFCLRHCKWRDPVTDEVRLGARFEDCEMPPKIAARALRSGAATRMDDPRRRPNKGTWGRRPIAEHCFNLDAVDVDALPSIDAFVEPPAEIHASAPNIEHAPVKHSAFEKIDRGPAYTITRPRQTMS
jgi:hypothetical protein